MDKLITCFLLLAVLNCVSAEDVFFGEGGTLVLRPRPSGEITSIQWKHNNNLVAEWVKGIVELVYYGGFDGRTTLDLTTGSLEIRNMSPNDSGVYSVEINNKVQPERYNAKLIKAVPKPVVSMKPLACGATSKSCTLHCEGDTEKAGPVTYSWKMGGEWMDGEKDRNITNNETIQSVETFSCRMKNLISEEESDPLPNRLFRKNDSGGSGVWLGVGLTFLVLGALGFVVYWKRENIKKLIFPENSNECNQPSSDGKSSGSEGQPLNEVSTIYDHVQRPENGESQKTDEKNDPPPAGSHGDEP